MLFDAPNVVSDETIEQTKEQAESPELKSDKLASEPAIEPKAKEQTDWSVEIVKVENKKNPIGSTSDAWRRSVLFDKIAETEKECTEKELLIQDLKEQLKEAKAQLEQSLIRLRRICGKTLQEVDHWKQQLPLPISSVLPAAAEKPEASPAVAPAVAVEAGSDEWRNVLTSDLLFGIKGLGAKKLEALIDLAPTLGALEDLRGEASKSHKTFVEVLPKGIGLELSSAIEERILTHLAEMAKPKPAPEPQIELAQQTEKPEASKTALDDL